MALSYRSRRRRRRRQSCLFSYGLGNREKDRETHREQEERISYPAALAIHCISRATLLVSIPSD